MATKSKNSNSEAQMKLYRDAAPDWFTDADLKSLVIKLEYNTAHINAAIQRLWDDSGQVETEWESQDKKKSDKKKSNSDAPNATVVGKKNKDDRGKDEWTEEQRAQFRKDRREAERVNKKSGRDKSQDPNTTTNFTSQVPSSWSDPVTTTTNNNNNSTSWGVDSVPSIVNASSSTNNISSSLPASWGEKAGVKVSAQATKMLKSITSGSNLIPSSSFDQTSNLSQTAVSSSNSGGGGGGSSAWGSGLTFAEKMKQAEMLKQQQQLLKQKQEEDMKLAAQVAAMPKAPSSSTTNAATASQPPLGSIVSLDSSADKGGRQPGKKPIKKTNKPPSKSSLDERQPDILSSKLDQVSLNEQNIIGVQINPSHANQLSSTTVSSSSLAHDLMSNLSNPSNSFLNLGKWETNLDQNENISIEFGSFGSLGDDSAPSWSHQDYSNINKPNPKTHIEPSSLFSQNKNISGQIKPVTSSAPPPPGLAVPPGLGGIDSSIPTHKPNRTQSAPNNSTSSSSANQSSRVHKSMHEPQSQPPPQQPPSDSSTYGKPNVQATGQSAGSPRPGNSVAASQGIYGYNPMDMSQGYMPYPSQYPLAGQVPSAPIPSVQTAQAAAGAGAGAGAATSTSGAPGATPATANTASASSAVQSAQPQQQQQPQAMYQPPGINAAPYGYYPYGYNPQQMYYPPNYYGRGGYQAPRGPYSEHNYGANQGIGAYGDIYSQNGMPGQYPIDHTAYPGMGMLPQQQPGVANASTTGSGISGGKNGKGNSSAGANNNMPIPNHPQDLSSYASAYYGAQYGAYPQNPAVGFAQSYYAGAVGAIGGSGYTQQSSVTGSQQSRGAGGGSGTYSGYQNNPYTGNSRGNSNSSNAASHPNASS